jgi:parallel beta-helix repeat protein
MKKLIFFFLLIVINTCQAQRYPAETTITASKDSILSDEVFSVTYSITTSSGYYYIGVVDDYFETIGNDRWEGEMKDGETKTITFNVKLKEAAKKSVGRSALLSIGFSLKPFGEIINGSHNTSLFIKIIDYDKFKQKYTPDTTVTINEGFRIITVPLFPHDVQTGKTFKPDTTKPRIENLIFINQRLIEKTKNIQYENEQIMNFDNFVSSSSTKALQSYTIRYSATSLSYINESGQTRYLSNFTVVILGLQTSGDTNPVILSQQVIENSATGSFLISTDQSYPYYQCALYLDCPVFTAIRCPDTWNGQTELSQIYGVSTSPESNPNQNAEYQLTDPVWSNDDFSKILSICSRVADGNNFVTSKTSEKPTQVLVIYNQNNSVLNNSYTTEYTDGTNNWPGIYIKNDVWKNIATTLHEYGHAIQMLYAKMPPESGGRHVLGIRYNSQLAYSEGWGHFFAAAVTSNAGINSDFNLSSNPPYSVSYGHHYTPGTTFEGNFDEIMVASLLWEIYSGTNYDYNNIHKSMKLDAGSGHAPYNIYEFIKNHRMFYDVINGTGYWVRAGQNLHFGYGLEYVSEGNSIQGAVNAVSDKYIVYVSKGTYYEDINISNKNIALIGEAPVNTVLISSETFSTNTININNGNTGYAVVNGFTIRGGNIGINIAADCKAYISNNIVEGNTRGICVQKEVILKNNAIKNNSEDGLYFPQQTSSTGFYLRAYNNVFYKNLCAIHFYDTQSNADGYLLNNLISENTNGIIAASSSKVNSVNISYNGYYGNTSDFQNVTSDGGDVNTNPNCTEFLFADGNYYDAGFTPPSPVNANYEFYDRTSATGVEANAIGIYGGPEGFLKSSSNLPSTPTGIEDGLLIIVNNPARPFNINQLYVGSFSSSFIDNYPYGNYGVQWGTWKVKAITSCGEIPLYESPDNASVLNITSVPNGYSWIRDANGNVKAILTTSVIDNDGFYHEASADILLGNVPNTFITSGTLTSDTYWCDEISITGSITVPAEYKLTIKPGATISFAQNATLTVYGILDAKGCTFTSQSGTTYNNWGSIILSGSAASGSVLENITMQYGGYIQFLSGANATLKNSAIYNSAGIYIYGSNPLIVGNIIQNSAFEGIYSTNSYDPRIYENYITRTADGSGNTGIKVNKNGAWVVCNDIQNLQYGIYALGGVYCVLDDYVGGELYSVRNNRVRNSQFGIFSINKAMMIMYDYEDFCGGRNSIYNNTYDLVTMYDGIICEGSNYYGGHSPVKNGSSIYTYAPVLTYDPWASSMMLAKTEPANTPALTSGESIPGSGDYFDVLFTGMKFIHQRNYGLAKEYFMKNINEGKVSYQILSALATAGGMQKDEEVITFLESLNRSKNNFNAYITSLIADLYLNCGDYLKFNELNDEIISKYPGTEYEQSARLQKFYYKLNIEKDKSGAYTLYSDLNTKSSGEYYKDDIIRAQLLLGLSDVDIPKNIDYKLSQDQQADKYIKEFNLIGNFPNPFNPSTTISYTLPYESSVELIIYDITGAEIKAFNILSQQAGRQSIFWDGTNLQGENVASGIYLYRIKLNSLETNDSFEKTAKLLMLK